MIRTAPRFLRILAPFQSSDPPDRKRNAKPLQAGEDPTRGGPYSSAPPSPGPLQAFPGTNEICVIGSLRASLYLAADVTFVTACAKSSYPRKLLPSTVTKIT